MKRWKATIRLAHGLHQVVFVSADTVQKATLLLELQFGKGRLVQAPAAVALASTYPGGLCHLEGPSARILSRLRQLHRKGPTEPRF
jgi:hypothetical protein